MSGERGPLPLRVETVLRLLPEVDLLSPLRALVLATSRGRVADAPFVTVGKRIVEPERFAELVPQAVQRLREHVTALYGSALGALEAQERGDIAAAVDSLLYASRLEERVGREGAALAWIEHAIRLAEEARDRRPELTALAALGAHETAASNDEAAARVFQRCLALAEAEGDRRHAAAACLALGRIAGRRENLQGASAWFLRGLDHAVGDDVNTGRLHLAMSSVFAERREFAAAAERLDWAESLLSGGVDPERGAGLVDAALGRAQLAIHSERPDDAVRLFHEALVHAMRDDDDPRAELAVRIALTGFLLRIGRLIDAEDEARRAEEQAVVHGRTRELARIYMIVGEIRRQQRDEAGMAFFEQAIELSRSASPTPRIEAEAYGAYARLRRDFGELDDARAYFERSRAILAALGDKAAVTRADAELAEVAVLAARAEGGLRTPPDPTRAVSRG